MAIQVQKASIELSVDDREFLDMLKNKCNSYGQLPYNLNELTGIQIIKEAARYFYKWYHAAVAQRLWGLIEKKDIVNFLTNNGSVPFKQIATFNVKLPPAVRCVTNVFERGTSSIKAESIASQLSDASSFVQYQYGSGISGGYSILGINAMLYVSETVCRMSENNVYESCASVMIDYSYNVNTKDLFINHNLDHDIIIQYDADIPLKYLYADDYFERYCIAKCYKEMRRVVGSHTIDLPSGATVNLDEMYDISDIENIERIVHDGSGVGDVIIWRQ